MDRKTIIKWQRYLKEARRLVQTGDTAADKYGPKATQGSHRVAVLRLEGGGNIPPGNTPTELEAQGGGEFLSGEIPPKVYQYGSDSGFASVSPSRSESGNESSSTYPVAPPTPAKTDEKAKPKPQTKTKGSRVARDGTPYPENFFSWTNPERIDWLCAHDPGFKPVSTMEQVTADHLDDLEKEIERERIEFECEMDEEPEIYLPPNRRESARPYQEKTENQTPKPKPRMQTFNDGACEINEAGAKWGWCDEPAEHEFRHPTGMLRVCGRHLALLQRAKAEGAA
jgi:hypothetical protein